MKKIELLVGGRKMSFHFGIGFYEKAFAAEKITDGNIMSISTIRNMYYSAAWAAEVEQKEFMSIYEFFDLIDDLPADDQNAIYADFTIALFRAKEKNMNLDPKQKKEFDKQIAEFEKKMKPQKVATAAK